MSAIVAGMEHPDVNDAKMAYGKLAVQDVAFHGWIARHSGNELIVETLTRLHSHMHLFRLRFHARDTQEASSMSRRGNCHNNAVAESFFQLFKRERIRRRIYTTRSDARADVFNYIEMFYNSERRHSSPAGLSPVEFGQRHSQRLKSV